MAAPAAPAAPATAPAAAPAAPQDDAAARREVTRMLKGPVAERFRGLMPGLAQAADPYRAIMESPVLLDQTMKLFRAQRESFAEFLVNAEGAPVTDDETRLKCGRSITEIIGMVVRTGMRSFAELHFGDPIDPARSKVAAKPNPPPPPPTGFFKLVNVARIAELFRRNHGADTPPVRGQSKSGRFYASIKDSLDFEWQVHFFPLYVEIPSHVFTRLGIGITRMTTEESLHRLANIAMADIQKAESIIKNPQMIREMMENNALASQTVSELGEEGFDTVHGALSNVDAKKKWDVFANRDTAKKLVDDKRISKNDIAALADYLDILNEFALDAMLDLHLNREQMQMFLKTAEENLGRDLFLALFGPIQQLVPDDPTEQQKLRKYQQFTQQSLRGLVTAVKQLEEKLRRSENDDGIQECLATVCRSRRPDLEKEIKKLAPASLNA